jgi:hypothetical protein
MNTEAMECPRDVTSGWWGGSITPAEPSRMDAVR